MLLTLKQIAVTVQNRLTLLFQSVSASPVQQPPAIGAGLQYQTLPAVIDISGDGIVSSENFGSLSVSENIQSTGIVSGETLGRPLISDGIVSRGIASQEAFGTPIISPVPVTKKDTGGPWSLRRKKHVPVIDMLEIEENQRMKNNQEEELFVLLSLLS